MFLQKCSVSKHECSNVQLQIFGMSLWFLQTALLRGLWIQALSFPWKCTLSKNECSSALFKLVDSSVVSPERFSVRIVDASSVVLLEEHVPMNEYSNVLFGVCSQTLLSTWLSMFQACR